MGIKGLIDKFQLFDFREKASGMGLDFSDRHLRSLSIEVDSGKIFLKFLESTSLKKGVIQDGKLLKKDILVEKLQSLKEAARKRGVRVDKSELVVPVPESRLQIRVFKVSSKAKEEKIEKAVLRKSKNLPSINIEESNFDYSEIPSKKDYKEVLFVAIPKKIIDDYLEITRRVGMEIDFLEPEFLSKARAVYPQLLKEEAGVIFDCGRRTTTISVFKQGVPQAVEELEIGGRKFTQAIANNLEIAQKEAEKLKKEKGLEKQSSRKTLVPVLNSMMNQFTKILDEIHTEKKIEINRVFLCGGSSLMPGIKDYFEKNLNLEIIRPDPFLANNIEVADNDRVEDQTRYAACVGASLRKLKESESLPLINLNS